MNMIGLHKLMTQKGYYYFDGKTNTRANDIYINFSTLHNGRGDWINFRLGQKDNDITYSVEYKPLTYNDIRTGKIKNISDTELINWIKNNLTDET